MSQHIDVFVSSTSQDLTDHRAAVKSAIESLGLNLIMMEGFLAEDATAVIACKRYVDEAEIYVGIYAHRYGWIPSAEQDGDGENSITALEYKWAKGRGIPRLCFMVDPAYEWPDEHREGEPGAGLLKAFKSRVDSEVVRATFTTPESLASQVRNAVSKALGWRPPAPPPPVGRYVGRDELLSTMQVALNDHKRVALTGIGGIGKTMTAAQIAQDMRETFSGGVLWVGFGTEAREPETLLSDTMRRWAEYHHPGRIMNPDDLKPEQVRYWLSQIAKDKPLLIVFDDIWHILPARELLRLVPDNAKLLITTRRADIARQLDIDAAQTHEIDRLSEDEGVELMRDRVGDMPSPAALRRIVELLGGHPLALDVIAAQITERGPDYADELPDLLSDRLANGEGLGLLQVEGEEERYANVEVALALTYESLSRDLQRRFRALGVLVPDALIPPPILSAVWDDNVENDSGRADSRNRMDALVSVGVLSKADVMYSTHGLLRVYARALLRQTDQHEAVWQRYAEIIIRRADEGFKHLPETRRDLDPDLPHVHYVGNALADSAQTMLGETLSEVLVEPEKPLGIPAVDEQSLMLLMQGEQFAQTVYKYIFHRRVAEGQRWLRLGLACARLLAHREHESLFDTQLASWHDQRGQKQISLAYNLAGLKICRELGDRHNEAVTLNNVGHIYHTLGQSKQALEYYGQSLAIKQEIGDRAGEATTLNNMGGAYNALGQKLLALDYYEQALFIRREVRDRANEATTLNNIGSLYWATGQPVKALTYYEQALSIHRKMEDRAGEAVTLDNIGKVYQSTGQMDRALAYYEQALPIRRVVEDRAGETVTLNNIGFIYFQRDQPERTAEIQRQIIQICHEIGNVAQEAAYLVNLAVVLHQGLGQTAEAIPLVEQSIAILERYGLPQSASGGTVEQYRAFLAQIHDKTRSKSLWQRLRGK